MLRPSCCAAKRPVLTLSHRIQAQRRITPAQISTQTKIYQNSSAQTSTLLGYGICLNYKQIRSFAAENPTSAAKPEKKDDEAATEETKDEEEEEDLDALMDDSAEVEKLDENYDDDEALEAEGIVKREVYQFQDSNKEQRLESWKFISRPNEGFTPKYKKIKAAYIGLPNQEKVETVDFPPLYRNKSNLATKQGKALSQFAKDFEVPQPRYGINVEIFLNKIGKDCGKYADKFKSWEELMTFRRKQLKKLEIPVKQRRWIRGWVEKYRRGIEPYSIPMKSIAKRNKEKKKEQIEAFKAIIKPRREATKAYREKTAPLRIARKKLMKKITNLVRIIRIRERIYKMLEARKLRAQQPPKEKESKVSQAKV